MGAAILAAEAGLKTGAGLVTAAVPSADGNAFLARTPELMTFPQAQISSAWLQKFDALVLGCGLGRQADKWREIEKLLQTSSLPIVLDADAFYGINEWDALNQQRSVLTPHPGEFAQLTGWTKPKSNREKLEQGLAFVRRTPTTLVLKGAPTLVFDRQARVFINSTGNSGMATAGSGDVLAGLIGGFLAQKRPPLEAALLATWIHGRSGDLYRETNGEETLTAGCLIEYLSGAFISLRSGHQPLSPA